MQKLLHRRLTQTGDLSHRIDRAGAGLLVHEWLNHDRGFFYTARRKLFSGRSRFQKIDLLETDAFGTTLLLDNVTQVSEKNDHQYHEPMVHPALCAHPRPHDVLVIGGGDGGIARETLKHACVRRLTLVELDGEVVAFARRYLKAIHGGAFDDPRMQVEICDGRSFLEGRRGEFDIIIMDMTDPFGPSRMLYTKEFFLSVKRALREGGLFVMHSESPVERPFAYNCVQRTLRRVFANVRTMYLYVEMYSTLWSMAVCSASVDIAQLSARTIDRRLLARGVRGLEVYTGASHHAMMVEYPYIGAIRRGKGRVISDLSPDFTDNIHFSRQGGLFERARTHTKKRTHGIRKGR